MTDAASTVEAPRRDAWLAIAGAVGLASLLMPMVGITTWLGWPVPATAALLLGFGFLYLGWSGGVLRAGLCGSVLLVVAAAVGAVVSLVLLTDEQVAGSAASGFWVFNISLWLVVWRGVDGIAGAELSGAGQTVANVAVPVLFGVWLLFLWQIAVVGFGVPQVLLPSPAMIAERIAGSVDILFADFRQTFLKAVLAGYVIGSGAGILVAVLVDRVPFLQRGLLPLGNFVSALPIVGIAPIMVMWFGFDWQSKAAVVVIMTFFPMLVNAVTGLAAAGALERDAMRSWGAGYWPTLLKLRFPAAMPFIFNGLKINSTLALIGAIVAEFFGTPIVGMGFRISTEVGRLNVDMVWAEIVLAAVAGSLFYFLVARLERVVTFWHASYRAET